MKLPGDDLGRSWVRASFTEPHQYDSILLTLVASSQDGQLMVIGNAFVIYAHQRSALCLTAAHNFQAVKLMQKERTSQSHPTFPSILWAGQPEYLKTDECAAVGLVQGQLISCKVDRVNYIDNYDVAVFTARSEGDAPYFQARTAIDVTMPTVGTEIAILGHKLSARGTGQGAGIVERNLEFLFGVVTNVTQGRGRMGQTFQFDTTIPIRAGMSGSPVLVKPEIGGTLTACGVTSSDFSEERAFADFTVPGLSTAAALWPSMGLGFEMSIEGEESSFAFLGDLLARKFLDDRSKGVTVTVQSKEKVLTTYHDMRTTPTTSVVLEMTGHPLAVSRE